MAYDKIVDFAALEAGVTLAADAIHTTEPISIPAGGAKQLRYKVTLNQTA